VHPSKGATATTSPQSSMQPQQWNGEQQFALKGAPDILSKYVLLMLSLTQPAFGSAARLCEMHNEWCCMRA